MWATDVIFFGSIGDLFGFIENPVDFWMLGRSRLRESAAIELVLVGIDNLLCGHAALGDGIRAPAHPVRGVHQVLLVAALEGATVFVVFFFVSH
jgi:hypothetical protein